MAPAVPRRRQHRRRRRRGTGARARGPGSDRWAPPPVPMVQRVRQNRTLCAPISRNAPWPRAGPRPRRQLPSRALAALRRQQRPWARRRMGRRPPRGARRRRSARRRSGPRGSRGPPRQSAHGWPSQPPPLQIPRSIRQPTTPAAAAQRAPRGPPGGATPRSRCPRNRAGPPVARMSVFFFFFFLYFFKKIFASPTPILILVLRATRRRPFPQRPRRTAAGFWWHWRAAHPRRIRLATRWASPQQQLRGHN
jgi:hypothetical protein